MKETSVVVKLFRTVGAFFVMLYHTFLASFTKKVCDNAVRVSADNITKSTTYRAFYSSPVEDKGETSIFSRIYCKASELFFGISDKIFNKLFCFFSCFTASETLTNTVKSSKALTALKKVFGWIFTLEGGFAFVVLVMFCVPNSVWNNAIGLGVAFAAVLFVLYAHAKKADNLCVAPQKTYISVLVFFLCVAVSTVLSNDRADSVRIFAFFLTSFLLYLAISVFLRNKKSYGYFVGTVFLVVVVTSIIGVVQAILKVEADASLTDMTLNKDMPGRVFSTFGNPNNFAQLLVLFLPFCAAFALNAKKKSSKIFLWLLMILPVAALLQTYSRSGWIAFAVATVMFVFLYNKKLIPIFIVICIIAIPFLPETVLARIMTIGNLQDSSSSYRLDIWSGVLDMLKMWWFTGVGIGPGAFKAIYPPYAYGTTINVAHSHMQFLEVLAETGILGLISFVWMTVEIIRRAVIAGKNTADKQMRNYCIAAASSMTAIIFIGFFEYYWFYPRVMFAFFMVAGLAVAAERTANQYKA